MNDSPTPADAPVLLSPVELAARWSGRVSVKTLANWRSLERGPRAQRRGGRVVYDLADVLAWEREQRGEVTPGAEPAT